MIVVRANETGARGDGQANDRRALQAAVDKAAAAGGGTVVVPSGMRCITGTVELKSRVELHLEAGSSLEVSKQAGDYPDPHLPALLEARGAEDAAITGRGVIEGRGIDFMVRDLGYIYEPAPFRPRLLCFYDCKGVRLDGITFHDSPFWTVHLVGCERVDIAGITIDNNLAIPNCDGIDPDHCRDVRIRDCRITCADDAIVLKNSEGFADRGACENVHVSDCVLQCTASAIKFGSGSVSDFRNCFFSDCTIRSSCRGLCIQLRDQGSIENVHFTGFQIETRLFEGHYWGHAEPIHVSAISRTAAQKDGRRMPSNPEGKVGSLRHVRFSEIQARSEGGIVLYGCPSSLLEDVSLSSIDLRLEKWSRWPGGYIDLRPIDMTGSDVFVDPAIDPGRIKRKVAGLYARCARGLALRDIDLVWVGQRPDYFTGPLELEDCERVSIDGFGSRS